MNANDSPLDQDSNQAENELPADTSSKLSDLEKRLAELRAQGILSGGDGPRETLRPVAHVPGALDRFLKARG